MRVDLSREAWEDLCRCGRCPWVEDSRSSPYLIPLIGELEAAGEKVPCCLYLVRTGPITEKEMQRGRELAAELGL